MILERMTIKLFNSKKIRTALLVISLLLQWQVSQGQTLKPKIDSLMRKHFAENQPGATIIISKADNVLYRGAIGLADMELGVKLSPDMKFYIGSNTKQFTAVSILILTQRGDISLTDNLCKYFPDFSNNCEEITIHHLLNHTSGIYDYTSDAATFLGNIGQDMTKDQMLTRIKNGQKNTAPGEMFSYNNSAYYLLGLIIEQITNSTYAEFVNTNIFEPLGMADSQYGDYHSIVKRRVKGYDQNDQLFTNASYWDMNQVYSAGGIISTIDDLLEWRNALNEFKVLDKEYLQLAQTNYKLNNGEHSNYGYGFFIDQLGEKKAIHHGGGFSGFISQTAYYNEEDLTIIILSNCWWTDNRVKDALINIAQIVAK
jgi:CubicO group peptidase (beta-lactamase class C family)